MQNSWGGPDSSGKRDWFAGAISDLISSTPASDMDVSYLEEFLLQVMLDEFMVNVDDGSAGDVAEQILRLRKPILRAGVTCQEYEELLSRWESKMVRGGRDEMVGKLVIREEDQETDEEYDSEDDDDDDDEGEGHSGMEMEGVEDAPRLVKREKLPPEVDEEGFTKVVGKRK